MVEYLLTLSLLSGPQFSDIVEKAKGTLSNPFVLIALIGLGVLLMRTRVR